MEATETTEKMCLNETCDFGLLSPRWNVCPECGTPAGKKEPKEEAQYTYSRYEDEDKDEPERMTKDCQNETCDLVIPKSWEFCAGCGFPQGDVEERPIVLNRHVAMLALYKLDPYVFKQFMFIYFETAGSGIEWKRLKQAELEAECSISHPKVLKSIRQLKGVDVGDFYHGANKMIPVHDETDEAVQKPLHWITQESRTEGWSKRQGYGLHDDMGDLEHLKELLKPFQDARKKRNSSWY